jgi:hypothetical protein
MLNMLELLDTRPPPRPNRQPPIWSEGRLERLRETAMGRHPVKDVVEPKLAAALVDLCDGAFDDAELAILDALRGNHQRLDNDGTFAIFLQTLFAARQFDLVGAMLRGRYKYPVQLEIDVEQTDRHASCLRWDVEAHVHRFVFSEKVYQNDATMHKILHLSWLLPLFAHYSTQPLAEVGFVLINQSDISVSPGLTSSDNRPDRFLIPDPTFVATQGYRRARMILASKALPWTQRKTMAFWRGSTTGVKTGPRSWQSLERIRLSTIAQKHEHTGLIDAGISRVVQFRDSSVTEEIRAAGLIKDYVAWQDSGQYKFLIDIDGNANAFSGLFQRLLTGSTVIKVESPRGLRQWYYNDLLPWRNYVPIAPDMSDLIEKIKWLASHDSVAERIGQKGYELATRLTYERELMRSVPVISAGFKHFRGQDTATIAPFGWSFGIDLGDVL